MIRGEFTIIGRFFAVADNQFAEILPSGNVTFYGTVANDGLPVTMAASPQQLLLASAGTAYVFDLGALSLVQIPASTFSGPVAQAEICDDFFILTIKNSKEFYVSGVLNALDWTTNGAAIVSVFPDNIVSMKVFQRQIWFFSDTQSVVYYDSGNIFPFDVNPNAFIEAGSGAENGVQVFNNSVAWLGKDIRGQGKVWLASGYTPTRISNHAVEFAIQGYSRIDDAVAWTYQDQGHEFYILYFPTPSTTWVYDANTNMWHQRGFWVEAVGDNRAQRYWNHVFVFGKHLVGAWDSNKIYEMHIPVLTGTVWTFTTDDGNPIVRQRRAPHVSKEQRRLYIDELQVFVETGLGPQPPLPDSQNPTILFLADNTGAVWNVFVNDIGLLQTSPSTSTFSQTLILNDPTNLTSWNVQVSPIGNLFTTPATFGAANATEYDFISSPDALYIWAMKVTNIGILQTVMVGNFTPIRPPKMNLRVSKDSAHTWGNIATRECGFSGEFRKRVRWLRLGQARDWVFEIQVSDPIGWRIVDAYINPPVERN